MNIIDQTIAWTLIHSLWEGAVVALALAGVLSVARSSRVRYGAACIAMLALLAGFSATFYRLAPSHGQVPAVVRMVPVATSAFAHEGPAVRTRRWDAGDLLPWLAPLWMAGVLLFQLRCLASWMAAGRLRRLGVCGAPDAWLKRLDALRERLRMARPVTLLESCLADVPVVIGHLRPVILVPVGLLAGLPAGQVEAILVHELAHIRRGDYLINLMQTIVEGLLFYHPAVWWISAVIRTERENCCDDLVVATSGNAHEYATALAALAENRWATREMALAATGGDLLKRIRRLLAPREGPRAALIPAWSAGILVVGCGVALAAWQSPQQGAPVVPAQQTSPAVTKYDQWFEEVTYIVTESERTEFKNLQTDGERDRFIEKFWARRDPTPGTPENEFKDEHYRRLAWANNRFGKPNAPGWKTDRGRIYVTYGPPDEIDSHPAPANTLPFERWRYRLIEGIGENVVLDFVDKTRTGDYRLASDPQPRKEIQRVLEAQAEQMSAAQESFAKSQTRVEQVQKAMEELQKFSQDLAAQTRDGILQKDLLATQAQVEQVQKTMAQLEDTHSLALVRRLQSLASQGRLLESETPTQEALENLRAMAEEVSARAAQRSLLESQASKEQAQEEIEELEKRLRGLQGEILKARQQDSNIFSSPGAGAQAVVEITTDRKMLLVIPIDYGATQYSFTVAGADGKAVYRNSGTLADRCEGAHAASGCRNSYLRAMEALPVLPGSYVMTAVVKDSKAGTEQAYAVKFSVK